MRALGPSCVVALLLVSVPGFASPQSATVQKNLTELRVAPQAGAKSRVKLPAGREVSIVGRSDDGRWIHVKTSVPKGEWSIDFDGWVAAAAIGQGDAEDPGIGSGGDATGGGDEWGAGDSAPATTASATSSGGSDDWSAGSTTDEKAPAADNSWDVTSSPKSADADSSAAAPASSDSSSSSGDAWGDSSSSSSSSASSGSSSSGGDDFFGSSGSDSSSSSGSSDSGSSSSGSSDGW